MASQANSHKDKVIIHVVPSIIGTQCMERAVVLYFGLAIHAENAVGMECHMYVHIAMHAGL